MTRYVVLGGQTPLLQNNTRANRDPSTKVGMTQTAVSGWQPPPYIDAIHRRKAMSVTADMLSAVIGYRDFQIPAKKYFYFLHREMLILTTGG